MQLDGGLVQVRLDAVPLGLDPVEVARGPVEGVTVVVVVVVAYVVVATEASHGIALLRQPY